jgi:hypothetical protein
MTSIQNSTAAYRLNSNIHKLAHRGKRWYLRSAIALLALCTSQSSALLAQPDRVGSTSDDNLVYWPRLDFVIPFNVDVTGQAPREIQLEVSENEGKTWKLDSRADVRTKQFQFNAKSDGEYQFRLKTLDSQGRTFDNPGEPLRILVDTKKPEGKLIVDIDQRGVMQAEFEIADLALDASSIQLAYQTEELLQWRDIPIELSSGQNPAELFGTGSWSIPNGTRQLVVRLLAKDKAGNQLEITRLPQLPRSASRGSGLQLASGKARDHSNAIRSNQAIGSGVSEIETESFPKVEVLGPTRATPKLDPVISSQLAAKDQLIEIQSKLIAQQQSASRASQEEISSRQFIARSDGMNKLVQENSALPETNIRPSKLPVRTLSDEDLEKLRSSNPISLAGKRTESVLKTDPDLQMTSRNNAMQLEPRVNRVPGQSPFNRDIQRLYSNSKAFSLDYHIDNDPDSPVAAVELWGTSDQGQTWSMWGQDPDRESPFDIEVETEGLFGFRMVIVGANGLASNRPRNGDNADAWIHVDVQSPKVKLVSALYGKGKESGSMVIEYRAEDDYFTDRPITLQYSQTPNGPWTNIVSGARNNGRYVWPADPSLPPTIYLRIEAYDAAGNVSVNQLELPVDVEGLAPRGRIQGFRPIK